MQITISNVDVQDKGKYQQAVVNYTTKEGKAEKKNVMSFKNKGTDYQLALDRRSMIKVFVGLLKTCDRSGWDLPNPHEWICISG